MAASPERVFSALKDLDAASKWMPNLVGIEKLSPGKFGVGTKWRETRRMFGREASEPSRSPASSPTSWSSCTWMGRRAARSAGTTASGTGSSPRAGRRP
ncbi:hypothetical protein ACN28I_00080 [Archangium gephyra]|uniref:hypothetical protein n=1 Tax=Archangium gephyra TaxID=48 RepID=UPI003B7F578E